MGDITDPMVRKKQRIYPPSQDTNIVIEDFGLRAYFPKKVIKEIKNIPAEISEETIKSRTDLRDLMTVTIDGERARDFDDAISIQILPNEQVKLYVHIADVSHYVGWDTPLDKEAYLRGTSVYFPDSVLPMFPEKLSNGICSLNPDEDRLTLTTEMTYDDDGNRIDRKLYKSAIRSNERMTYTIVSEILGQKDKERFKRYEYLFEEFKAMKRLCLKLKKNRMIEGSIDFDLPDPEIILDNQGQPIDIINQERNIAHQIIEEFMLEANKVVAEEITASHFPMVYRVHEEPDQEDLRKFREFSKGIGIKTKWQGKINPKDIQKTLESMKGKPEEHLINKLLLRCMKQARYSTENKGHFGLAFKCYTHFTSPIRRYPDLVVHRILKEWINNQSISAQTKKRLLTVLPIIAKQSSEMERLSMDAERELMDLKKVRYIKKWIGEEFDGIISGVTKFGLFVEIRDLFIDGLLHISNLHDDYYVYLENEYALAGERRKKIFRIGDRIRIRVEQTDISKRRIDLSLVE